MKHWEGFSLPVAIFIWDIYAREGRWCLVKELISKLDQNNSKWRKNKTDVQVSIPWENGTDTIGLKKLNSEIGKQVYPLISFGKDLSISMKLTFPNTTEGVKLKKSFDLHIKEGEPLTLKGDVIQELKFSDWWDAWFGGFDVKDIEIHIGQNVPQQPIPISFKIIPVKGKTISLSNLEFRLIRAGTELIRFSNEHTSCPLLLNFSIRKEEKLLKANLSHTFRHVGGDPHEIMDFLDFTKTIASGGKLRVEFPKINQSYTTDFLQGTNVYPNPTFYDLVQKLCIIQDKIGRFFVIPNEGITQENANSISELFEIIEHGVVRYKDGTMSLELKGKGLQILFNLHREGQPIQLRMIASESYIELFGEKVETGPMIRETTSFVELGVLEFEDIVKQLPPNEFLDVKLIKVNGTESFSNWNLSSKESS